MRSGDGGDGLGDGVWNSRGDVDGYPRVVEQLPSEPEEKIQAAYEG